MDFLFSLFYSVPYLPYLLGALALLVVYQKFSPRARIRVPGGSLTVDDVVGKLLGPRYAEAKLERAVSRYKKGGHYIAAGKLYEDAGKLQEAAEAYQEGNEFFAAATVYEKMGRGERAGELYLQSGDYKKAAQVLIDGGKPAKAALLFLEKGNSLEAARLFALAGQWEKAGDLYARSGYPLRAAEAYEKQGAFLKAAECYEKHFMENVSYATTYSSTAPSADQKSALLAGRLYEKAGELSRALQAYNKGGYFKEAAGVCMALAQFTKAAELYLRAEDPQSAAGAYEQAGDPVQAANLRGEVALRSDQVAEAARFFQQGKDYLRAAELFESIGLLADAAGAYEAGESFAAAGSVYIRAGLKDRAAASYERADDLETAAKLYEEVGNGHKAMELYGKAGLTYKSGEAAARAGEREKAIALLQRVGASDENYRAATELLAQLFVESRMPGLAVERLQKALQGQPVSPGTLDLYYWLSIAYEMSGNSSESLAIYKKILSEDLQYRDVDQRVQRIQSGAKTPLPVPPLAGARPAPAGGAPATGASAAPSASNSPGGIPASAPPSQAHAPGPHTAAPHPPAPAARSAAAAPKGPPVAEQEELGRGALGVVYRAQDQVDGRSVALRVLPPQLLKPEMLSPLVADLKASAQISHPNLVKVLGLVEHGGGRAVVSEFVSGKNFAEALKAGRKMNFQQAHTLGRVVAQALSVLHSKGIVHGSIQPSNIMVSSGVIKVADLGLGRLAHARPVTPESYGAPENGLDVQGDLYALAAVLYHLLTGVHPKSQPQGPALPLPSTLAPGVPEAFDKLLLRGLHPRHELRFDSADSVLRELKDMVRFA